jgi:uncharacterized protein YcnI
LHRPLARLGTATLAMLAALVAMLVFARPALAHTEIELNHPQAGATNVTMNVTAEAENDKAGIASVRMVLPDGIAPSQVSLASGPAGWTLSPLPDGFTVGGPALATHTDAKFAVKLAQLPATATTLAFKTLVAYANGAVDRWIEIPSTSNPSPANPAPVVTLQPVAAPPTSATPTAGAASPSAAPTSAAPQAGNAKPASAVGWWLGGLAVLVLAALVAVLVVRRRRRGATPA